MSFDLHRLSDEPDGPGLYVEHGAIHREPLFPDGFPDHRAAVDQTPHLDPNTGLRDLVLVLGVQAFQSGLGDIFISSMRFVLVCILPAVSIRTTPFFLAFACSTAS